MTTAKKRPLADADERKPYALEVVGSLDTDEGIDTPIPAKSLQVFIPLTQIKREARNITYKPKPVDSAKIDKALVDKLRRHAKHYWEAGRESGLTWTNWQFDCMEHPTFNEQEKFSLFFSGILQRFLQKVRDGYQVTEAMMEGREPMKYTVESAGEIIRIGLTDGFLGIIGTAIPTNRRAGKHTIKIHSRQIAKAFYQYVSRSV